ncbi:MAG: UDP-N-acetylmuramate dehydrogenase [Elusimicrobia bacterium]|nr:UDP-N-acetylmuramate dehydrogenase [Elusimicrobiota bacterium]
MPGLKVNEPLKSHTTFHIGGPAAYFAAVPGREALCALQKLSVAEHIPLLVIGRGSNILFRDKGYAGIVATLEDSFTQIVWDESGDCTVHAGAGASLARLVNEAADRGYGGLAGCGGIPGTVGGAVFGNAGTNGGWIGDCVTEVVVLTSAGEIQHRGRELLQFSYRSSNLQGTVVMAVHFSLKKIVKNDSVIEQIRAMAERRKDTQPLGDRSAGCVFKNPPGDSAGRLIDFCGLKGLQVGGARVSDKHANFIVNTGTAASGDVEQLIGLIREKVKMQFGIELALEIEIV